MRAADVVAQLAIRLPQLTDKFTDEVPLINLSHVAGLMTGVSEVPHGLAPGEIVAITGAEEHVVITSFDRIGLVGTIVTAEDHDLTEGIAPTVTTSGANEAEFNGTKTVTAILNRRTITVLMADAGPTSATGSLIIAGAQSLLRRYNGTFQVKDTLDPNTFTFNNLITTLPSPASGTLIARAKPRISAGIQIDRLIASYTEQEVGEYWMFVILEDVNASKGRSIESDAVDNIQRSHEFRQQIIQPFTIYVFIPVANEIAGRLSRDTAEDLFQPICQSLLFSKFDSGLYVGATQGPVQFGSHGVYEYNPSVYIHAYNFIQVVDIVFDDTVGPDLDVAFRDIDLTLDPNIGTSDLIANIDLDDVELP